MNFHMTHGESDSHWTKEYVNYKEAYNSEKGDGLVSVFKENECPECKKVRQ